MSAHVPHFKTQLKSSSTFSISRSLSLSFLSGYFVVVVVAMGGITEGWVFSPPDGN